MFVGKLIYERWLVLVHCTALYHICMNGRIALAQNWIYSPILVKIEVLHYLVHIDVHASSCNRVHNDRKFHICDSDQSPVGLATSLFSFGSSYLVLQT